MATNKIDKKTKYWVCIQSGELRDHIRCSIFNHDYGVDYRELEKETIFSTYIDRIKNTTLTSKLLLEMYEV